MSDKLEYTKKFLETLCNVNVKKHERLIANLFYRTAHIKIQEEQAKIIFKDLLEIFKKDKKEQNLYKL